MAPPGSSQHGCCSFQAIRSSSLTSFSDSYDLEKIAFEELARYLPGAPVVKTVCFHRRVGWVQCLVRELRSYMPHGQKKKKKELAWLEQSHLDNLPFTILGDIITGAISQQFQVLKNNFCIFKNFCIFVYCIHNGSVCRKPIHSLNNKRSIILFN